MEDFSALGAYPANRVFGLVVFVDPSSFWPARGLDGGVRVASCGTGGGGTLPDVLGGMLGEGGPVVDQETIGALADRMLSEWVDRDGSLAREREERWREHKEAAAGGHADVSGGREDIFSPHRSSNKIRATGSGALRKRKSRRESARHKQRATRQRLDDFLDEYEDWLAEVDEDDES